ncbi:S8 family serine peptidase [Hymenobacter sp. BT175]|uniref:S8 family serine peptidase n=1 Tax=Hymenobacter translucens TaxID=2886507 RepID=UPI001D0DC5F5|nr:S8 family serine peptidase [Hymenobacter translucens]MCC2544868.1 S8 family serine peptidase [Hymenobacter translucens]
MTRKQLSAFVLLASSWLGAGFATAAPGAPEPAAGPPAVRKHLIYFRDKANSPYSVTQPQAFLSARSLQRRTRQNIPVLPRDLPVNPSYVSQVKAVPGAQLLYTSRWFNAAMVSCDSVTLAQLQALPSVRSATTLSRNQATRSRKRDAEVESQRGAQAEQLLSRADYGRAFRQADMIGAVAMHNANFRGEGMQIAVFDAGFPAVDVIPGFTSMLQERRLASTFNFVDKTQAVFLRNNHGTATLSTMAGNQPGYFIGTAPKATYHLLITEDINSEHPVEEANWLVAAEYADSVGVDIISSSLGYTTFDFPSIDYTYNDLNGRTAISSRAATMAARVGILVVNSAGNEGGGPWRYISAPADADSIMTVGAVDSLGNRAGFSSYGPTADGRIKPNLAAQGQATTFLNSAGVAVRGNGTSFSCPVLAGMIAGFWQANRNLTAQQVISFMQRSGTRFTSPNNEVGYGIPHFVRAYNLANPSTPLAVSTGAKTPDGLAVYPNPTRDGEMNLLLTPEFRGASLRIRLYDGRGSLVSEQQLEAPNATQVQVRTGHLAKGQYTCLISNGKIQRTVRFEKI